MAHKLHAHSHSRPPLIGPEATVEQWMTRSPECIAMHQSLATAQKRMVDLGVRHLPVLDGGQLVGVISDRDLGLLGALAPEKLVSMRVEDAMSGVPYCVPPHTPVREVARHMATRKVGSAIVMDQSKVLGVFTTTDALAALAELLRDSSGEFGPRSAVRRISIVPR